MSTLTVTERPGRSTLASGASAGNAMRTGTRWTILVKLPVALSGGSRLNCAPVAGAKLSTVPVTRCSGKASTDDLRSLARLHGASCVSLKFAVT